VNLHKNELTAKYKPVIPAGRFLLQDEYGTHVGCVSYKKISHEPQ
jgi:hypothetical protein